MIVEEMSDQQLPFDPSKLPTEVLLYIASWLDRMNDRTRTETRETQWIRCVETPGALSGALVSTVRETVYIG
jgi:hypothetical protein